MSQPTEIREISSPEEIRQSARVIRAAFRTVAAQFDLTRANCPAHTAFLTAKQLAVQRDGGLQCFGLFLAGAQSGFIAIEPHQPSETGAFWIEKLAVLPGYRHGGLGAQLVTFAIDRVRRAGGKKVALGMIDEHRVLKDWYTGLGFQETATRKFPHLPFTVCFMEKHIV